jgi:hypothetical protein
VIRGADFGLGVGTGVRVLVGTGVAGETGATSFTTAAATVLVSPSSDAGKSFSNRGAKRTPATQLAATSVRIRTGRPIQIISVRAIDPSFMLISSVFSATQ